MRATFAGRRFRLRLRWWCTSGRTRASGRAPAPSAPRGFPIDQVCAPTGVSTTSAHHSRVRVSAAPASLRQRRISRRPPPAGLTSPRLFRRPPVVTGLRKVRPRHTLTTSCRRDSMEEVPCNQLQRRRKGEKQLGGRLLDKQATAARSAAPAALRYDAADVQVEAATGEPVRERVHLPGWENTRPAPKTNYSLPGRERQQPTAPNQASESGRLGPMVLGGQYSNLKRRAVRRDGRAILRDIGGGDGGLPASQNAGPPPSGRPRAGP